MKSIELRVQRDDSNLNSTRLINYSERLAPRYRRTFALDIMVMKPTLWEFGYLIMGYYEASLYRVDWLFTDRFRCRYSMIL